MNRILGYTALAIFVVSAVVHFSTYIPSVPITLGVTWPLHVLAIAACGAMALTMKSRRSGEEHSRPRFTWSEIAGPFPFLLRAACFAAGIYAVINFVLFMILMEGGSP